MAEFLGKVAEVRGDDHGAAALPLGERIGKFEILAEIGRGTFGVVLLARDTILGHLRALKVPCRLLIDDQAARLEFLNDARLASEIDHPNVVRVLDADDVGGTCYIVMEYCPEGSLAKWLKLRAGAAVPPRWAALLVAQIAEGVHQAHVQRITHRDLKPGNVLLWRVGSDDGEALPTFCPKVADFGLACRLPEGASVFGAADGPDDGSAVGTTAYMSPEQARGETAAVGWRSDVYGLGAILFELVAGRRLYPEHDMEAIRLRIVSDAPSPDLEEVRPEARDLAALCRVALAKTAGERFRSAADLADALRRFARGERFRPPWWERAIAAARRIGAAPRP